LRTADDRGLNRKVREVLRLRHALSLSYREISEALGVGKTSAGEPALTRSRRILARAREGRGAGGAS